MFPSADGDTTKGYFFFAETLVLTWAGEIYLFCPDVYYYYFFWAEFGLDAFTGFTGVF